MACNCSKVERSPLWAPVPEPRTFTTIDKGENIECYAKRSGSESGLKDDIGEQLTNRILNTSFASSLAGVVNETFQLTPNSDTAPEDVDWQFSIDGTPANLVLPELEWGGDGIVTGTVSDANANKVYHVLVVAKSSGTETEIDSRRFTFFPKKGEDKDGTVRFVIPLVARTGNTKARVTCGFGPRNPPVSGASTMHNGYDMAMEDRSLGWIVSSADGVVVKAGPARGFGNWVVIEHYDAQDRLVATTVYGHMNEIYVRVGDKVAAGQKIALEGNAGIGTAAHLHFEIHKGKWRTPTDPGPYLNGGEYIDGYLDVALGNDDDVMDGNWGDSIQNTYTNMGMTSSEASADNDCASFSAE